MRSAGLWCLSSAISLFVSLPLIAGSPAAGFDVKIIHTEYYRVSRTFDPDRHPLPPPVPLQTFSLGGDDSVLVRVRLHNNGTVQQVVMHVSGYFGAAFLYSEEDGFWRTTDTTGHSMPPGLSFDPEDTDIHLFSSVPAGQSQILIRLDAIAPGSFHPDVMLESERSYRIAQKHRILLYGILSGILLFILMATVLGYFVLGRAESYQVLFVTGLLALCFVNLARPGYIAEVFGVPPRNLILPIYITWPLVVMHFRWSLQHLLSLHRITSYFPDRFARIEAVAIGGLLALIAWLFRDPGNAGYYWPLWLTILLIESGGFVFWLLFRFRSIITRTPYFAITTAILVLLGIDEILGNILFAQNFDETVMTIGMTLTLTGLWLEFAMRIVRNFRENARSLAALNAGLLERNLSLDRSFRTLRQYAEIVSHLLRRPVANISQIVDEPMPDSGLLRRSARELDATFLRLQDYLTVHLAIDEVPSNVTFPDMMLEILGHFRKVHPDVDTTFQWTSQSDPVTILCNRSALHGLLSELFLNAVQHGRGTRVIVNWNQDVQNLILTIEQDMPATLASSTVRKFERYRVGRSGVSIGFGIMKLAAEILNADLSFSLQAGEYPMIVKLVLPIDVNQSAN